METKPAYIWTVERVVPETPDVSSLYLRALGVRPSFIAGQYFTVRLPDSGPLEGKSYSISSAPHEELVRITIKQLGRFSSALLTLRPSDTLTTSAPYGFFYPDPSGAASLVFIAGGIGITPCLSIIANCVHVGDSRDIHLFYSNRTEADIVFKDELDQQSRQSPNLSVHHFITRETPLQPEYTAGRISAEHIQTAIPDVATADFFLCGSLGFTGSFVNELRSSGVAQRQIYTEGFF